MLSCLVVAACAGTSASAQGRQDADTILARHARYLHETVAVDTVLVRRWMRTISEDGRWPDIQYKDLQRANWDLLNHLKRVEMLALAWSDPKSAFYHSGAVWESIRLSLDNWLTHQYKNPNWWHNQIGVPQYMRDIMVLLKGRLSPAERARALQVLGQLRVQGPGAGANLTWSADLGLYQGLLTGDTAEVDSCQRLIVGEIRISTAEGLQPDYSFHQHGSRLQMYQYGKAFLWSNARLGWELRGTRWAFPEAKVDLLSHFLIRGWAWMARGINTVPGTMDRSSSRVGELRSPDVRVLIPYMTQLDPARTAAFRQLAETQHGQRTLEGFRYFPYSDFAAYQQKDFSFFVKTISTRTLSSEVGLNSENLKGALLNSGDAYLIHDGEEYYNLMPLWDWRRLPGITSFDGATKIDRRDFVGGVTDGHSGLNVMDYRIRNKKGDQWVSAHKIWAADKGLVVCLVAGLTAHGLTDSVYTVLDQSRRQGPVVVNRPGNDLKEGTERVTPLRWACHAGFAYIPTDDVPATIQVDARKGTWSRINVSEGDSLLHDTVFTAEIIYGPDVRNQSFGYVLAYSGSARKARALSRRRPWKVLENDSVCQAVKFPGGTVMAAFFSAAALHSGGISVRTDKPCLLLYSRGHLYASDPTHKGGRCHINWGSRGWDVDLPSDGTTREVSGGGK